MIKAPILNPKPGRSALIWPGLSAAGSAAQMEPPNDFDLRVLGFEVLS